MTAMDATVMRSMLRWPDVPDVYGWLQLDRRGAWRIRSAASGRPPVFEPIGNAALNAFIGRNYAVDERGCWFFQNGPQKVFVSLAYAPLVFRIDEGELVDHCGRRAREVEGAWLDEEGSLIVKGDNGVGLLDDRDLARLADDLSEGFLRLGGAQVALEKIGCEDVERRFGFTRVPEPRS